MQIYFSRNTVQTENIIGTTIQLRASQFSLRSQTNFKENRCQPLFTETVLYITV